MSHPWAAPGPAGAIGAAQRLRGVITIEFPSFDPTGDRCKADRFGSVSKLKGGNRVLVYRGVTEEPGRSSIDISDKPIARGKVRTGKVNDTTDNCDVAFTVPDAPVLPDDEFYVVEVRGIATTQTISASTADDGDLGSIPASI